MNDNNQTKRKISILDHIEDIVTIGVIISTAVAIYFTHHQRVSSLIYMILIVPGVILQIYNVFKKGNNHLRSALAYLLIAFGFAIISLINAIFATPQSLLIYFYRLLLPFTLATLAILVILIVRQIRVYKTSSLNQKEETKKFLFSDYIEDIVLFIIIIVTFSLTPLESRSLSDDFTLNVLFLFPIVLEIINIFSKNKNNRGISNIIYGIVIFRFALMPFMLFVSGRVLNVFALDYFESSYIMLPIVVVLIIIKNLRVYKKSTIKVIKEEAN